MKPTIKINYLYYGTPFNLEDDFFYKILKKKYNIVISDKPDYVFFSVYKENNQFLLSDGTIPKTDTQVAKKNILKEIYRNLLKITFVKDIMWRLRDKGIIKPYAKIIDIEGDFVKIFYCLENLAPDMNKCDWAFGFKRENEINHPNYMRIPPYVLFLDFGSRKTRKFTPEDLKREKTRFCNYIYNTYVPYRNKFFRKLSKYKHIDSPGKSMNNMPPLGSHKTCDTSRSVVGWDFEKLEFIKPYKFTAAIENTISNGFNTDRLVHALYSNTVPIFIGDKTVNEDFNENCFINCTNMEEGITKIIELDNNDKLYLEMLNHKWWNGKENPYKKEVERLNKRIKEIFK